MIKPEDIHSLTDFQRNTREHVERLRQTGRPEILTVNGEAQLVVQHAAAYQRMLEELERSRGSPPRARGATPASASRRSASRPRGPRPTCGSGTHTSRPWRAT